MFWLNSAYFRSTDLIIEKKRHVCLKKQYQGFYRIIIL
jgi:hypothetical protein